MNFFSGTPIPQPVFSCTYFLFPPRHSPGKTWAPSGRVRIVPRVAFPVLPLRQSHPLLNPLHPNGNLVLASRRLSRWAEIWQPSLRPVSVNHSVPL